MALLAYFATCLVAGGKLVYQYTKKRASGPKCPVTGKKIQGVSDAPLALLQYTFTLRFTCIHAVDDPAWYSM